MCLTEPHCGTDLGLIKTKAEPNGDGSYKITGTKIFISAGEHDLAENIIHLVLARLPDAPAGIRGISLFVCPKFLPDASGSPGHRNAVALRLHRAQDGHQGVVDLRDEFRRRPGLAGRQAAQGHVGHVHHDERGAPCGRHAGPRPVGSRLSGCRHLRQGSPADAFAFRRQVPGQARRSHHRASRRAAHAADHAGTDRRLPRAELLGRHGARHLAATTRRTSVARKRTIWWRC